MLLTIYTQPARAASLTLSFFWNLFSWVFIGEPSTLDEVYALCQEKWFWGSLDAKMAEKYLMVPSL